MLFHFFLIKLLIRNMGFRILYSIGFSITACNSNIMHSFTISSFISISVNRIIFTSISRFILPHSKNTVTRFYVFICIVRINFLCFHSQFRSICNSRLCNESIIICFTTHLHKIRQSGFCICWNTKRGCNIPNTSTNTSTISSILRSCVTRNIKIHLVNRIQLRMEWFKCIGVAIFTLLIQFTNISFFCLTN